MTAVRGHIGSVGTWTGLWAGRSEFISWHREGLGATLPLPMGIGGKNDWGVKPTTCTFQEQWLESDKWSGVKLNEKWSEVKRSELGWSEVKWRELMWGEHQLYAVKGRELRWGGMWSVYKGSEMKWRGGFGAMCVTECCVVQRRLLTV